ncbi:integral component of membrane [Aeromonas phage pAh6.2TG]|uniref:Integral component of membrane n=1 Tax=Aeromonas phage pAh6.2TG TaxID=2849625 RepID=A0A8F3C972_9CAUD|nr:integral component of membrane [Aeromonas phage pAh6.2TG]QWY14045.1 integral component of membrane [Aeromonas phage pAh6.2TG]
MTTPLQTLEDSVKKVSALEKGGLFVILLVVLYFGRDIYLKGQEREEALIIGQLGAIAQQQMTLQQSLANMQATVQQSATANSAIMEKLEGIENNMVQFVYATETHLVLRTPKSDGAHVVKVPLAKEKS